MGKVILGVLAVIGIMAICATVFQRFWFAILAGGPLGLGIAVIAIFLLGVFLGSYLR